MSKSGWRSSGKNHGAEHISLASYMSLTYFPSALLLYYTVCNVRCMCRRRRHARRSEKSEIGSQSNWSTLSSIYPNIRCWAGPKQIYVRVVQTPIYA